jgi:hypothetical protein
MTDVQQDPPSTMALKHRGRARVSTTRTEAQRAYHKEWARRNRDRLRGGPPKQRQRNDDEMEEAAEFLIRYAEEHGPVTVRGLYYQAEVAHVVGIDKTEKGYRKVQRDVLNLRRAGRLDYDHIADATRWMRKPRSHGSITESVEHAIRFYRKRVWDEISDAYVEVWCAEYDVPLMVTRGFTSETFAYEAVEAMPAGKPCFIYYIGDFDRAGRDAGIALAEKLHRFANQYEDMDVRFEQITVTLEQIEAWNLPTREPKRNTTADKKWPFDFACEVDAIPPDTLREIVREAINRHMPAHRLKVLRAAEQSEREGARRWLEALAS